MLELYELSKNLKMEFATASYHNSYYFHKDDNVVTNKDVVTDNFFELIDRLLSEKSPKSWFRAFFNLGLINYIRGNRRLLPCEAGTVNFFIDPYGEVYPCNGLEERYWKESFGNIRNAASFDEIWYGPQADKVRSLVRTCPKNCWMVGTAAPVMKKYIRHPAAWVLKHKLRSLAGKKFDRGSLPAPFDVGQDPHQGDLRETGKPPPKPSTTTANPSGPTDRRQPVAVLAVENPHPRRLPPAHRTATATPSSPARTSASATTSSTTAARISPSARAPRRLPRIHDQGKPRGGSSPQAPRGEARRQARPDRPLRRILLPPGTNPAATSSSPPASASAPSGLLPAQLRPSPITSSSTASATGRPPALRGPRPRALVSCVSREVGGTFRGRITDYLRDLYYLCGNPIAVKDIAAVLLGKGIPDDRLVREFYYAY
jgi:radical SAM protein with 4Fe4S-binding SPASM domain